jgi:5-methyltetrahydrofolate--homocysteine methyltransferase
MTNLLEKLLAEREWLLADGATGTNLFSRGLEHGDAPELWNLNEPEKVREHYRSFIEAGSDIVLTNSFGGTANRLKLHGLDDRVYEVNRLAAALLKEVIAEAGREVVCAGSVGPTGDLFQPLGALTLEDGIAAFTAQMEGLRDGGADVVWIETMSSDTELRAALEAARKVGIPAVCTMSFDTNGRTMMGITPARLVELVHGCQAEKPIAFGGNCGTGAPDLVTGLLSMKESLGPGDMIVAKANCGIPQYKDGHIHYSGTPELMADYAVMARDLGARIIGGCCGTEPKHVAAMREALETRPKGEAPDLQTIIDTLGPLTGSTADLVAAKADNGGGDDDGGGGGRRGRRGGRRRAA